MERIHYRRPGWKWTCLNVVTVRLDKSCRLRRCSKKFRIPPINKLAKRWTGTSADAEHTCASAKRFIKRPPETGGRHEFQIDQQTNLSASEFYCRRRHPARPLFQAVD